MMPPTDLMKSKTNKMKQKSAPTFSGPQRVPSMGESSLERQEPFTEHQRIWQTFWSDVQTRSLKVYSRPTFKRKHYSHQPRYRTWHWGRTGAGTGGVWCSALPGEPGVWWGPSWKDDHPDRNPNRDLETQTWLYSHLCYVWAVRWW